MARLRVGGRAVAFGVLAGTALATAAAASCLPSYDFGAGSDGGGPDGTTLDDGGTDGTSDALVPPPPPPTPQVILDPVALPTGTGNAQQQHVAFAKRSARWWFFYVDAMDTTHLKTRWSQDFKTWTEGAALALPMAHGGDGRNLSVAYRAFGNVDVVHVATSLHAGNKRVVYETRATIDGSTITFGAPSRVHDIDYVDVDAGVDAGTQGDDRCDPDGNGIAIGDDGYVYVATAWVSVPGEASCDSNVMTSRTAEDGTAASWSPGNDWPLLHFTVPGQSNARQILAQSGGAILMGWEAGDDLPPTNVRWAAKTGSWTGSPYYEPQWSVFPGGRVQAENDWSMCRVDESHIYAVRRAFPGDAGTDASKVFELHQFDGAKWTAIGATLPDDEGVPGSGVSLVTNGKSMLIAAIGKDGAVRHAIWNGSAWGAWATLSSTASTRSFLSGSGCDDPAHPTLVWTEGAPAHLKVVGVPVAGLMP